MSAHHSQMFPCISKSPKLLANLKYPAGVRAFLNSPFGVFPKGCEPSKFTRSLVIVSPNTKGEVVPARQAYSHSASVGRRNFLFVKCVSLIQNSSAFSR